MLRFEPAHRSIGTLPVVLRKKLADGMVGRIRSSCLNIGNDSGCAAQEEGRGDLLTDAHDQQCASLAPSSPARHGLGLEAWDIEMPLWSESRGCGFAEVKMAARAARDDGVTGHYFGAAV